MNFLDSGIMPKALKASETLNLFRSINLNNREEIRSKLVEGNMLLVASIIHKYYNTSSQKEDLFQIGCIGLIKSIDKFKVELDLQFSTYAVPMIIGEIRRYLKDNKTILHLPRSIIDIISQIVYCQDVLKSKLNRSSTIKEISNYLNKPEELISECINLMGDCQSLDSEIYNDNENSPINLADKLVGEDNFDDQSIFDIDLENFISELPETWQKVINYRIEKGMTQKEISKEINLSQAQVSRIFQYIGKEYINRRDSKMNLGKSLLSRKDEIIELLKSNMPKKKIAKKLVCSTATLYAFMKHYISEKELKEIEDFINEKNNSLEKIASKFKEHKSEIENVVSKVEIEKIPVEINQLADGKLYVSLNSVWLKNEIIKSLENIISNVKLMPEDEISKFIETKEGVC